jgi:hypothetical protein
MYFARDRALCDLNGLVEEKAVFPAAYLGGELLRKVRQFLPFIRVEECGPVKWRTPRIGGDPVVYAAKHHVTEKMFMRVDVTEEFPFLVTKMSPYYDR